MVVQTIEMLFTFTAGGMKLAINMERCVRGSVVCGIIPTLFDYFEINMSFSILLFVTHLFIGTIVIIFILL